MRCWRARFRACGWSTSGTWATATCTTTCRRRRAGDARAFLREQEERVNTLVYDAVEQFGGSFSAEHGIGELKVHKLEKHKSPVALGMMRAIKAALDPQNILNPGRVLRTDDARKLCA